MTQSFTFNIRVRANASNNKVGSTAGDPPRLIVAVQAPAVDGKAFWKAQTTLESYLDLDRNIF